MNPIRPLRSLDFLLTTLDFQAFLALFLDGLLISAS